MSDQITLRVERREGRGKGPARRLRREGKVPANVYGREIEPVAVQADRRELDHLLGAISFENTLIDLQVDRDPPRRVLIREVQKHPYRPLILHVDFFEIRAGEKIRVGVPVQLVGTPAGVRVSGGVLQQNRYELEVECLPSEIPERFEIDVSELEIGDSVHVEEVDTSGLAPLEDPGLTVCTVLAPRVVAVEVEEEEAAEVEEEEMEPEVITARGEEEESEPGEGDG